MSTTYDDATASSDRTSEPGRPEGSPAERELQRAWALVGAREIRVKLTDRNFLVTTGVTLALLIGIFGLQAFIASQFSAADYRVATVAGAQGTDRADALVAQSEAVLDSETEGSSITAVPVDDEAAGRALVESGDVDALLLGSPDGGWRLATEGGLDGDLQLAVEAAVRTDALTTNAAAAGTTLGALQRGATLELVDLNDDEFDPIVLRVAGLGFGMIFYLASLLFGLSIANSVVEEKQSRIVEILTTAIPVRQLLIGKVLGNTVLAIGQMLLLVGAALVGLSFTSYDGLLPLLAEPVLWYLPFFVAGFVALACIWAGVGALASRAEDLQSTTMPVTLLLVVVFVVATSVEGVGVTIGSYVPVMSTILMPLRLLQDQAAWWEPVLALAITLAFSWLTIRFGSLLYRRALLQTQGRVGLRAALAVRD